MVELIPVGDWYRDPIVLIGTQECVFCGKVRSKKACQALEAHAHCRCCKRFHNPIRKELPCKGE